MSERVRVEVQPPYEVWVGAEPTLTRDALASVDAASASRVAVISDANVVAAGHAQRVVDVWRTLGVEPLLIEVPAGEGSKSVSVWAHVTERLAAASLDRDAWVCAVGGGVVGDLAGFVAATFLRGVPFVQVPTTLLAMVDASVGGKTGLDLDAGKNLVGAFWQPRVVIADVRSLATLPPAVLREGAVELYKHALLVDAAWRSTFHPAPDRFGLAADLDPHDWAHLVAEGVRVKADVVAADPLERGVRAHLNLGHTLAHALETVTAHGLAHGSAVAYGLAFAAHLGHGRGLADWRREAVELARWAADGTLPDVDLGRLVEAMGRDKKRRGGKLRFVLLERLGRPIVVDDVERDELERAWSALRSEFTGGTR